MKNFIEIKGARVHNLKNIDIKIPRDKLVILTGLSGSGKSSLAFDTIFAEGHGLYPAEDITLTDQYLLFIVVLPEAASDPVKDQPQE